MAEAEPSDHILTANSCGGEDGSGGALMEAHSSAADHDEYVTASASCAEPCKSTTYVTACMSNEQILDAIERSREQGWTEVKDGAGEDGAAASRSCHAHDSLVWEELKKRDRRLFRDFSEGELQLGRLIGEGGQAQIYEAKIRDQMHDGDDGCEYDRVAKVFKMEGFSLTDLQRQWPLNLDCPDDNIVPGGVIFGENMPMCSQFYHATVLEDGRFAFLMHKYWGDLRTLIDLRVSDNKWQGPPFSPGTAVWIITEVAWGMASLHKRGVLHRDLKAANVLVRVDDGDPRYDETKVWCEVADYECAIFVQGTGFWRAPEVLEELMKHPCDRSEKIWTDKVDTYSYAMTCYEVLTRHIPFFAYEKKDWKRVTGGERPHLPNYIHCTIQELVERCWHKDPLERPSLDVVLNELRMLR